MDIRELVRDGLTEDQLGELVEFSNIADPFEHAGDPPVNRESVFDSLSGGGATYRVRHYGAFDNDGRVVGAAQSEGTVGQQNDDACEAGVLVHPAWRRRGIGTLLDEHVRAAARKDGRTKAWAWGILDEPTNAFWRSRGLEVGYEERISRLVLDEVDSELMQSWIDRAAERAHGYRLESWAGPCPDELVDAFAQVREAMDDAPTDDLEYNRELWTAERIRDLEQSHRDRGLRYRAFIAIENASGTPAGYTSVRIPRSRPAVSEQSDTVTIEAHRGKGLGRWMKAAMWQWVREEAPEVASLDTGNAESNDAMLAINVEMGFRPTHTLAVWHQPSAD